MGIQLFDRVEHILRKVEMSPFPTMCIYHDLLKIT